MGVAGAVALAGGSLIAGGAPTAAAGVATVGVRPASIVRHLASRGQPPERPAR